MADLNDLTVREMGVVARRIGMDPMRAVMDGAERRWEALALTAWMLAKRSDPTAGVDRYLDLTITELIDELGLEDEDQAEAEAGEVDPTAPA